MLDTPKKIKDTYRSNANQAAELDNNKLCNTNQLKERLMREMLELDQQRQQLEMGADTVDFSMLNSYKTMIQHRHNLLAQISKHVT